MGLAVLVLRVDLALVFLVAAGGKLRDLPGSRRAAADFGLPRRVAGMVGTLLPFAELSVALALLITPTARWAAAVALLLLLAFVLAIGRLMQRGRAPECHCFGQLHSEPAGTPVLIRNVILAVVAGFAGLAGPGRSLASLTAEDAVLAAMSAALVGLAVAAASLWRENRELHRRPLSQPAIGPGLPLGTPAPDIALTDLHDQPLRLRGLIGDGIPSVLLHISPDCAPCRDMTPHLKRWQTTLSGRLRLLVVSSGDLEPNMALADELGMKDLLLAPPGAFAEAYQAPATPSAVALDVDGRVTARTAAGQPAIESLIRVTLTSEAKAGPGRDSASAAPLRVVQSRRPRP